MQPVFYERPTGAAITLRTAPRLANWNRAGDSGQARLVRALNYSEDRIDPELAACSGPVAVRFDVGLHRLTRLLDERDLDNYLMPLTAELSGHTSDPIVSVWGSKRYADETTLRVQTARPGDDDPGGRAMTLTATATGTRDDFKAGFRQQVHDQVRGQEVLADGPLTVQLSFVVGPKRDWLDLWWATLDALGPLLGQSPAEPQWHPRDGRIVDLGLHRAVDLDLGDDVVIGLRAAPGWLDPVPDE